MRIALLISFLLQATFFFCQSPDSSARPGGKVHAFTLEIDSLHQQSFYLSGKWLFSPSDSSAFKDPAYNDSQWDTVSSELYEADQKRVGFKGSGWFRLHFVLDSSFAGMPLALHMDQEGASEIYLNGKLIEELGKVGKTEDEEEANSGNMRITFISADTGKENVIAIRYSNTGFEHSYDADGELHAGFTLSLMSSSKGFRDVVLKLFLASSLGLAVAIFFFTLGLVHFLLWLFYRSRRSNLYFTLFSVLLGYYFMFGYLFTTLEDPRTLDLFTLFLVLSIPVFFSAFLAVLYSAFYDRFPKQFWIFLGASVLSAVLILLRSGVEVIMVSLIGFGSLIECLRIVAVALKKKKRGASIIGSGFGFFGFFVLVMIGIILISGGFTVESGTIAEFVLFSSVTLSVMGLPMSMSIFLAWDYAATNKTLKNKLDEVELLSVKNLEQEREKQKILETQKETLAMQVEERTKEINDQKKEIEEKNKDITDSINYAQRIQRAILPADDEVQRLFPQSFVLFMPRDIVSGDFYWVDEVDGKKFIVCADCTGHGVPGALMSMIGCNLLRQIIGEKKIHSPGKILSHLQMEVRKALKQQSGDSKDGMDMAICMIDGEKIYFAGAQRPLLVLENGQLREIKADKQSIGGSYWGDELTFTQHELNVNDVQALYMFSDGFPDQFGGPKGKKFKYKQLMDLLEKSHAIPPRDLKDTLRNAFHEWKGNLEQIDDVCVVGVKF